MRVKTIRYYNVKHNTAAYVCHMDLNYDEATTIAGALEYAERTSKKMAFEDRSKCINMVEAIKRSLDNSEEKRITEDGKNGTDE